jgi:hypothetical protein
MSNQIESKIKNAKFQDLEEFYEKVCQDFYFANTYYGYVKEIRSILEKEDHILKAYFPRLHFDYISNFNLMIINLYKILDDNKSTTKIERINKTLKLGLNEEINKIKADFKPYSYLRNNVIAHRGIGETKKEVMSIPIEKFDTLIQSIKTILRNLGMALKVNTFHGDEIIFQGSSVYYNLERLESYADELNHELLELVNRSKNNSLWNDETKLISLVNLKNWNLIDLANFNTFQKNFPFTNNSRKEDYQTE